MYNPIPNGTKLVCTNGEEYEIERFIPYRGYVLLRNGVRDILVSRKSMDSGLHFRIK